mmetsp:Transcript_174/g.268  ORF Transcript_174/g.268 Transcript_174/m.268 type:complete len:454 (-) Transcript_174:185-1546(-)
MASLVENTVFEVLDSSTNPDLRRRRSASIHLNNPTNIIPIRIQPWDSSVSSKALSNNNEILSSVKNIVLQVCPSMTELTVDDIDIKQLGGGLTNVLYLVEGTERKGPAAMSSSDGDSSSSFTVKCLVRVNGKEDSDILVDREIENRVSAFLSGMEEAPRYFGRFLNGRVEEFYDGAVPLCPLDLGATPSMLESPSVAGYASSISSAMGRLHKLKVGDGICKTNRGEGQVWEQTDVWISIVEEYHDHEVMAKAEEKLREYGREGEGIWTGIKREWDELKSKLRDAVNETEGGRMAREITFTHMDCQSLNILTNPEGWGEHEIKLIDFEYSGHNPRALDIGNTWCEHCNANDLKADWEKEYPSQQQKEYFVHKYLAVAAPSKWDSLTLDGTSSKFLSDFIIEVDRHALISHLCWTVWSFIQERVSVIDFDYLEYARGRWEGYNWLKGKLVEEGNW